MAKKSALEFLIQDEIACDIFTTIIESGRVTPQKVMAELTADDCVYDYFETLESYGLIKKIDHCINWVYYATFSGLDVYKKLESYHSGDDN